MKTNVHSIVMVIAVLCGLSFIEGCLEIDASFSTPRVSSSGTQTTHLRPTNTSPQTTDIIHKPTKVSDQLQPTTLNSQSSIVIPQPANASPSPTDINTSPTDASLPSIDSTPSLTDTSPSPTDTSTSTMDTSASPMQKSSLPTDTSRRPTNASPSPTEASTRPTKASPSPTEASTRPTNASPSPTEASTRPTNASPSPTEASTRPTNASPSPTEASTGPTNASQSSTEVNTRPTNASPSPTEASTRPMDSTTSQTGASTPATNESPQPTNVSPPSTNTSPRPSPQPTNASTPSTTIGCKCAEPPQKKPVKKDDCFKVNRGQLTFDAEGQEGGRFHSRKLHVPTDKSGLTIGRGYDMKEKTKKQIETDLRKAGIDKAKAKLLSCAAGLRGKAAKKFIKDNKLENFEITPCQQKKLFEITYEAMEKDVRRIVNKKDVVELYGKTDWNKLLPAIKEILIDLRFRGDYTPETRKIIQRAVAENDLKTFTALMEDRNNWKNVPKDRFQRRVNFLLNFKVNRGQLTFDAEGQEGGRFHSRKLHVPTDKSGLTIGRGYDMKDKPKKQIEKDLREAGICKAKLLSCAAGLRGKAAKKFIKDNKLENFEITPCQQKKLFEITYEAMEKDVRRIVNKKDVVELYGKTDWNKLLPAIKEILIDLRFRGDYTPETRKIIQRAVAKNDLKTFTALIVDRSNWKNVPKDRYQRRVNFLLNFKVNRAGS
ncbi:Hypothetical predicted protein [Paramuricea clavata]|uniref:Uncharacterized protein n=1 Tax=Paramuricea clavata TaxID=317549 RepID=A0A6S7IGV7_PARCT|nr:Hypothetical predicted protein [Paramuricea clavata]